MKQKIKTIWGVLTGNLITGYLTIGVLPDGKRDLIVSSYKPKEGDKVNYEKSIILPQGTVVFIPKLTEGKIETPDEWLRRNKGKGGV